MILRIWSTYLALDSGDSASLVVFLWIPFIFSFCTLSFFFSIPTFEVPLIRSRRWPVCPTRTTNPSRYENLFRIVSLLHSICLNFNFHSRTILCVRFTQITHQYVNSIHLHIITGAAVWDWSALRCAPRLWCGGPKVILWPTHPHFLPLPLWYVYLYLIIFSILLVERNVNSFSEHTVYTAKCHHLLISYLHAITLFLPIWFTLFLQQTWKKVARQPSLT